MALRSSAVAAGTVMKKTEGVCFKGSKKVAKGKWER